MKKLTGMPWHNIKWPKPELKPKFMMNKLSSQEKCKGDQLRKGAEKQSKIPIQEQSS